MDECTCVLRGTSQMSEFRKGRDQGTKERALDGTQPQFAIRFGRQTYTHIDQNY
jgi:hypothetical protein